LDPGDAADVEWLVLAHLKMSHLSQRRDLEDMALIESFARELRTVERLEMLYLLTYADMASVSPENWTEWKARLLRLLYEKAHATLLAEELDQPAHAESLELRRERLARAIEPLLDEPSARKAVPEFARALPERYVGIVRADDAVRHLKLWRVARRTGFAAELRQRESGEAELILVASDRPGLLALFSAALAANGIDILAAEVNSLEDGIALDRFIVREPGGGAPAQGRWEAAHADLLRLLSGAEDPHRLVQRRLRRASWAASAAPAVETKVRVDNVSSEDCTILDVFTQDRPGLLHAIADALHRAGASIEVARIATEGNRATDAFYLREVAGRAGARKIGSDDRLRELQAAVAAAIAELAGRS
jgi:[protein-PII] uridylyltransferase